jgi:hypothetical protein
MARRRRNPEIIAGRVNADGSIAGMTGGEFTVQKTSTGTYMITLPASFRPVSASGNPISAGAGAMIHFDSVPWDNRVRAFGFTSVTTPAFVDVAFTVVVVGVQQ